ncbi:Crp/Fnr family transcriptional regulator [Hymenobacter sp. B81]|uniref:Crp/Fnr family transcriptional regulator n=1 Tax=Hymenobacter sp. B81 TaxID=3344878 RepID=UPI0037DC294E
MEALLSQLAAIYPLSTACQKAISNQMQPEHLPAQHHLLVPGQVASRIYFLKTGLARGYYLKDGHEVNAWFMREGDFLIAIVSFLTRTPAADYIQLLEDSVLWSISHAQLQALYHDFVEFNVVGRILTERYYVLSEQRAQQLRLQKGQARYEQLLREFPDVLQRVPLKFIASYLGLTPETISRIRARRGLPFRN